MKKHLIVLFFFLLSFGSLAFHIVGGEIFYDYLGSDQYRITLKVYRDCNAVNASPFDGSGINGVGPAYITIYDGTLNLLGLYDIGAPIITNVPPAFNNPCIQTPNTTCIEEGVYTYTITLPAQAGGYTVVYQRCCRNASVVNLLNSDSQGSSYYTKIPGPEDAINNSSPRFSKFPPIYICNKVNLVFDHSAVDPDGDQLVYSLCAPYIGLDACCPTINGGVSNAPTCVSPPPGCPSAGSPPPYTNVQFVSPYSGSYPIASNPAFSINPGTGQLSGTPNTVGQYVVGVCVQEYRNNVLINTHFRDFQFTVLNCTVTVLSAVADQMQKCQGQTIAFTNQSINNSASPVYHWDFGVTSLTNDTSNLVNPSYMYPDTGIYTITLITNPGRLCSDTLKKPVYVYPPLDINFARPDRQCFKNNSFNFKTEGTYLPQTSYLWNFTSLATPSTSTQKDPTGIQFLSTGLFLVTLKAQQFACRDSFTDSVSVIRRPKAKINNFLDGLCDPARIAFSNGSSSDLPVRYTWIFSNGTTSNAFEPIQLFTPAGTYAATLVVETTELCNDTSVAIVTNINVTASPIAAFSVTPRETSIFEPVIDITSTSPSNPITNVFNFGDGQGSISPQNQHTYADFGDYKITQVVVDRFGCSDTTTDVIRILPEFRFWIPNTFTPDNNGNNDVFLPYSIGVVEYEFEIFDRWGEKIFKTTASKEGWNGSYKGRPCQQGAYAWRISFKNVVTQQTETHLGHVTLLRSE